MAWVLRQSVVLAGYPLGDEASCHTGEPAALLHRSAISSQARKGCHRFALRCRPEG
jgi:hypothetical protein